MAGVVSMTVVGDKALIAKLNAALVRTEALKPYFLWDAGEVVRESIREEIVEQGLIRTGDLIRSGRTFYRTKNGISVGYGKDLDYAEPLEFGARAHVIRAGNDTRGVGGGDTGHYGLATLSGANPGRDWSGRRMLSFTLPDGGWFFGPEVDHPGNKPYRYVYKGTMGAVLPLIKIFREYLAQVFKVSF